MRVGVDVPGPIAEPRIWVQHEQVIGMALQSGAVLIFAQEPARVKRAYRLGSGN